MKRFMIEIRGGNPMGVTRADIVVGAETPEQAAAKAESLLVTLGCNGYVDSVYQLAGTGVH